MAGFREFQTGEVLTAANVNNFLMKQSVMVFADDAARTTALGAEVAEGMLTYNEDTAQLEVFDGSAFVLAAPAPPAGIGSNVVSVTKTDPFSTSSRSFTDLTGLTLSITPTSDTSKILVLVSINGIQQSSTSGSPLSRFNVVRNSTDIGQPVSGTAATMNAKQQNFSESTSISLLDSPATASAVTYKVTCVMSSQTLRVNNAGGTTVSSITAIEVAA